MKMNKIVRTVAIDPLIWQKFKKYAESQGRSVSSLIEEFMRSKLEQD